MSDTSFLNPIAGLVVPLEQIPDPVFAAGTVGHGFAMEPTDGVVRAPFSGKVVQLHRAHHAISISNSEMNLTVLIHVGIDSVRLNGLGFSPRVRIGDAVQAGQTVLEFDMDLVAGGAKSLVTPVLITEGDGEITAPSAGSFVAGGAPLKLAARVAARFEDVGGTASGPQVTRRLAIKFSEGLHARPAARLMEVLRPFRAQVHLLRDDRTVSAQSLTGLLSLELALGDSFTALARGSDAALALDALEKFLASPLHSRTEASKHDAAPAEPESEHNVGASDGDAPALPANGFAIRIASSGLASGRALNLKNELPEISDIGGSYEEEHRRLQMGLRAAREELEREAAQLRGVRPAEAAIFDAHAELLADPEILSQSEVHLRGGLSAPKAWRMSYLAQAKVLRELRDPKLRQRAADVMDVGRRVESQIGVRSVTVDAEALRGRIVFCESVQPSDVPEMARAGVVGVVSSHGGVTSHAAVLAKSFGIPYGVGSSLFEIPTDSSVILDGVHGRVLVDPTPEQQNEFLSRQSEFDRERGKLAAAAMGPAVTTSGRRVMVLANIGTVSEAERAVANGAEGVGLLRSEFLFLDRDQPPSEDEQLQAYQAIADALGERPLTIRTLDVGGDKPLPYLHCPPEENPFLGVRGIRLSFQHLDLFKSQLRSIYRVRSRGTIKIMAPMITTLDEVQRFRALCEDVRREVNGPRHALGIMVEVPTVALQADRFAQACDFFSIGTNDLTQYTLAVDRGNSELQGLSHGMDPGVLRLIEFTATAARKQGISVSVCGGLAGETQFTEALVQAGVGELSVSAPQVGAVKAAVRGLKC